MQAFINQKDMRTNNLAIKVNQTYSRLAMTNPRSAHVGKR